MPSAPTTLWAGTTGPRGDRPGPDSTFVRVGMYIALLVLMPIALLFYGIWVTLFTYARMPWWVPAPVAGLLWFMTAFVTGGPVNALLGHVNAWKSILGVIKYDGGFGSWFADNGAQWIIGQVWFGLLLSTSIAAVVFAWKWIRRPKWEHRNLYPGPVLWRRYKKTKEEIASGVNSPTDGVTVGVAADRRDPRFAGGKPGTPFGGRVVLKDTEGAGHCLVVGGSGAGKTTTMLLGMRDVIRRGHGLIVVDCKGGPDVPEQLAEWAARYGREFYHWSMVDPRFGYDGPADGPAYYDPISRGDASRRKDLIIGSQRWDVEYYKTVIGDYLQTLFNVAALVPPAEGVDTMQDVADLLSPEALIRRAIPIPRDRYPELMTAVEHAGMMGETEKSGIANMRARLNTMRQSIAGTWLRHDPEGLRDIDLLKAADEGWVVVFSLDTSNYEETSAQLAGLIVQDLKTVSSALREEPAATPTHVYIDEFSAVDATNIYGLLAKARDAKMPVTLATQALSDLKRREHHFDSQVLGIVGSFIIHRANSEEDSKVFAGLSGLTRKMVHRMGVEGSSGTLGTLGAASATGGGYLSEEEDYRVPPGVFQDLTVGQCVLIAKIPENRYVSPVHVVPESPVKADVSGDGPVEHVRRSRHESTIVVRETFQQVSAPPVPVMPSQAAPNPFDTAPAVPQWDQTPVSEESGGPAVPVAPAPVGPSRPSRPVVPGARPADAPVPLIPGSIPGSEPGGAPMRSPQPKPGLEQEWDDF